jgi:hypothetical protein
MSDPNEKRKAAITKRAKSTGNHKVAQFVESFIEKMDDMGPHAGVWLEGIESDWDKFAKPEGLLHSFKDTDFADLREALFGYKS